MRLILETEYQLGINTETLLGLKCHGYENKKITV